MQRRLRALLLQSEKRPETPFSAVFCMRAPPVRPEAHSLLENAGRKVRPNNLLPCYDKFVQEHPVRRDGQIAPNKIAMCREPVWHEIDTPAPPAYIRWDCRAANEQWTKALSAKA